MQLCAQSALPQQQQRTQQNNNNKKRLTGTISPDVTLLQYVKYLRLGRNRLTVRVEERGGEGAGGSGPQPPFLLLHAAPSRAHPTYITPHTTTCCTRKGEIPDDMFFIASLKSVSAATVRAWGRYNITSSGGAEWRSARACAAWVCAVVIIIIAWPSPLL